ncbi:MAG: hypothetical protein ACRDAO_02825 [Culicoidibacterales bacterium]
MTTYAKTQQLYAFLYPKEQYRDEENMAQAIVEYYQMAGFPVLDIDDVFLTIAFYDYAVIETLEQGRQQLYRQLVGYGLIGDAKMKSISVADQEQQIVEHYRNEGVNVNDYQHLLTYFPWASIKENSAHIIEQPMVHKLF